MTLILASGSPRRKELLQSMGLAFRVQPSDIPEKARPGEDVRDYVVRLAAEKADAVAQKNPGEWVVGADTVVYLDGTILEKPHDAEDAVAMLGRIAGREHTVYTGVALRRHQPDYAETSLTETQVTMCSMTPREIAWYVATGEPLDKAGAYAVQGIGAALVESIRGNYTNVVGLPLPALVRMLRAAGIAIMR